MKDKLQKILTSEGLAPTKFAEIIGVQRSSISHILSGRNNPSYDLIQKILEKFPKLNPDWLLLGKGEMYRRVVQTSLFADHNPYQEKDKPLNTSSTSTSSKVLTDNDSKINEIKPLENRIFEKKVERVIVFYKDKTFTEYIPE
jgi:transcriptional regulator with XRE-family HTH domain